MADQTKEVKKKHLTNTEISDGNGSGCSNLNAKEQTRKTSNELNPSNEHSVNLALKVATSLLQSVFLENRPVVLPVNLHLAGGLSLQVGETGLSPLILPASSTVSMPLVLDQHLNSQFTPSSRSCPFANIQKNENLLLSQPEALVYHTDVPVFQSHGTATCLQDLIPSLSNYASAEYQITGQDQPISLPSNFLPHEIVQPTSTPMTPLATLLVPYPFVVPLPVPLPIPIPIPIQIPQSVDSKTFIKTSKTGSMIDKSTKTSPTISCCTSSMACPEFPHTPSVSQDEVLDLSLKATQTKRENVKSPSPNSALDLSVVRSNSRLQNGQNTWSIHDGNGNNITRSKYEDYNGKTVRPTQTVIVTPTETAPAPLCDKRRGFSWDCMINSPTKPDRIQDTVPQDSSRRLSTAHPPCSEPQRQILNNKNVHFKRDGSQNMYGDSPPFKKQHLAYFLP